MGFRGAIFDVDGVLVDSPHERAWRETLRELMETRWSDVRADTTYSPERFTPELYQHLISGKPRMSGARAALEYFHVPGAEIRADAYAERKQQMVVELIEHGEFTAFPDALRFVLAVRDAGIRPAAASSSKNAGLMLGRIRLDTFAEEQGLEYDFLRPDLSLLDLFDVDISGRDLAHGKPDPEIFFTAARELALRPRECFVVEDAVAGVEAASAGGIAALGVARADDVELLTAAHADLVVATLDDVDLDRLVEGRLASRPAAESNG
jgi:beta-phosphoglucomutase-like phosphatase (HAD superfamily)